MVIIMLLKLKYYTTPKNHSKYCKYVNCVHQNYILRTFIKGVSNCGENPHCTIHCLQYGIFHCLCPIWYCRRVSGLDPGTVAPAEKNNNLVFIVHKMCKILFEQRENKTKTKQNKQTKRTKK